MAEDQDPVQPSMINETLKLKSKVEYLEKTKQMEIDARCKVSTELKEAKIKISMCEDRQNSTQEALESQERAFKKRTDELITIQRVIRGRASSESKINVIQDLFDSMKNPFE